MKKIFIFLVLVIALTVAATGMALAVATPEAACKGMHTAHHATMDTPGHDNIPMCPECPHHE